MLDQLLHELLRGGLKVKPDLGLREEESIQNLLQLERRNVAPLVLGSLGIPSN